MDASSSNSKGKRPNLKFCEPPILRLGDGDTTHILQNVSTIAPITKGRQRSRPKDGCSLGKEVFKRLTNVPTTAFQLPQSLLCSNCGAIQIWKETKLFCCQNGRISIPLPRMPQTL